MNIEGATVYVTLEPCSHYGRTPPCALALINHRVGRVVAAMKDPNPLVAGKGLAMLEAAGIPTACGVLEEEAWESNRGFFTRMTRGTPWVTLKVGASIDGRTALPNGESQWITGEAARQDVQRLRSESGAILTGIGARGRLPAECQAAGAGSGGNPPAAPRCGGFVAPHAGYGPRDR